MASHLKARSGHAVVSLSSSSISLGVQSEVGSLFDLPWTASLVVTPFLLGTAAEGSSLLDTDN